MTAPPRPPAVPRLGLIGPPWAAAALAAALAGCSAGEVRNTFGEATTGVKVCFAAEKAYLHRGDLFRECCPHPCDFKHGFKNGYRDVAMNGDDCCAPPTPPACYWGCCTTDPCERVERLNCYYDGWAHGAIAAGQDGVAGLNVVPIRNICGEYGGPGPGGPFGPGGPVPPPPFAGYGEGGYPADVPPAPTPRPLSPERLDGPLGGGPTPAPVPLPVPDDAGEGSVGGSPSEKFLEDLLDSDAGGAAATPAGGSADDVIPADGPAFAGYTAVPAYAVPAPAVPASAASGPAGDRADGPTVTALWGVDD